MPKRTYAEFAAESETNLVVLTADGGRIPAHAEVLRLVCSCLKNAPASDTWDLRQLLVDGKAPTAETVTAVLEVIYQGLSALDFQMDKSPGRFSLLQLRDMLLFADAVGCSKGCLENLCSLLGDCVRQEIKVKIRRETEGPIHNAGSIQSPGTGPGPTVAAQASTASAAAATQTLLLQLDTAYGILNNGMLVVEENGGELDILSMNDEQQQQLRLDTSQQLESLLYTAFKLGLKRLQEPLLLFLRSNAEYSADTSSYSVLSAALVLSARVLGVAGAGAADLVSRACLQLPIGQGIGIGTVFKVPKSEHPVPIVFSATMLRDMYEFTEGSRVVVGVDLVKGEFAVVPSKNGESESDDNASDAVGDSRVGYDFGTVLGPSSLWRSQDGR